MKHLLNIFKNIYFVELFICHFTYIIITLLITHISILLIFNIQRWSERHLEIYISKPLYVIVMF